MKILFWIDPISLIIQSEDSSFLLMKEALDRGYEVYFFENNNIFVRDGKVYVKGARLTSRTFNIGFIFDYSLYSLSEFTHCFLRKEPPVDDDYRFVLRLLSQEADRVSMLNHPQALLNVHEKIWVTQFPQWTPRTLISSSQKEIQDFIQSCSRIVIKPLDGFGGQGICIFDSSDTNIRSVVEMMTQFFVVPIIVQEYLPQVIRGDKRISIFKNHILGVVLRCSQDGEHCQNVCLGGQVMEASISPEEEEIIHLLKPQLFKEGIDWVGLDFIDNKLTEVNVTSLACVKLLVKLGDLTVAGRLFDYIEEGS